MCCRLGHCYELLQSSLYFTLFVSVCPSGGLTTTSAQVVTKQSCCRETDEDPFRQTRLLCLRTSYMKQSSSSVTIVMHSWHYNTFRHYHYNYQKFKLVVEKLIKPLPLRLLPTPLLPMPTALYPYTILIISPALKVMKNILLFYMCHFAMGFIYCYKTDVFCIYVCSYSTKCTLQF